jgi:hypothetical protein
MTSWRRVREKKKGGGGGGNKTEKGVHRNTAQEPKSGSESASNTDADQEEGENGHCVSTSEEPGRDIEVYKSKGIFIISSGSHA